MVLSPTSRQRKKEDILYDVLKSLLGRGFFMAKKGQTFNTYSEELKREVIRLKLEEGWSYRHLREHFGIKSDAQIVFCKQKEQRIARKNT
jgi:transposase-like protein